MHYDKTKYFRSTQNEKKKKTQQLNAQSFREKVQEITISYHAQMHKYKKHKLWLKMQQDIL